MQLTLFNPQGTVVKMFVILFDLTEMPPNSETFLRQRTFYMPSHETDASPVSAKWLRYLIHLRYPAHLSINKKSILLNNSILPLLCHQVSQFKIRSNPLAHRHPNDCVAQVGCRYGFGTHCRKLLRVEIFHTRPVQPTLLQPLRSYYEKYCLLQKWKKKKKKNLSQKKLCHAKIEIVVKIFLQRFVRVSVSCDILSRVAARPNFFFSLLLVANWTLLSFTLFPCCCN